MREHRVVGPPGTGLEERRRIFNDSLRTLSSLERTALLTCSHVRLLEQQQQSLPPESMEYLIEMSERCTLMLTVLSSILESLKRLPV